MVTSPFILYRTRKVLSASLLAVHVVCPLVIVVLADIETHIDLEPLIHDLVLYALPISALALVVGGLGLFARTAGVISLIVQGGSLLALHIMTSNSSNSMGSGMAAFAFTIFCFIPLPIVINCAGAIASLVVKPRRKLGHCRHCGYNLRGLTEPRCPECGTPFGRKTTPGRRPSSTDAPTKSGV